MVYWPWWIMSPHFWLFPAMVPMFAICFAVVGPSWMWIIEEWVYRLTSGSDDEFLFTSLRKAFDVPGNKLLYRLHPSTAGISLLLCYHQISGSLGWTKLRIPHAMAGILYIMFSTMAALSGLQLAPSMYANDDGKWWLRLQGWLLLAYNTLLLMARRLELRWLHSMVAYQCLSLLLCAGVGERAFVLFFLPHFRCTATYEPFIAAEQEYLTVYSAQFKYATLTSCVLGLACFLRRKWFTVRSQSRPVLLQEGTACPNNVQQDHRRRQKKNSEVTMRRGGSSYASICVPTDPVITSSMPVDFLRVNGALPAMELIFPGVSGALTTMDLKVEK
jgi:hypothetical protein